MTPPPPIARVAAIGPAVLGVLLTYFAFFLHGATTGAQSTLASVYFGWTLALAAAHLLVAPSIAQARIWAVFAGGALCLFGLISSAVLLLRGSVPGAFGVALGLASVLVLGMALPTCLRMARAHRERIAQHPEEALARGDRGFDLVGLLVALGILGAFAGVFAWRSRTPGTPAQEFGASAFGHALTEPLTDYVTAIGHDKTSRRAAEAREQLLSKGVQKELGAEALRDLREVLETARVYATATGDDAAGARESFWRAVNGLDARLESRGVPGFVGGYSRGDGDSRAVWVLGYFARARASVQVGDAAPRRVVWARRLDALNFTDSAAALDGASEWTVLSLDALEEELLAFELPAIARGAPMRLVQGDSVEQGPAADLGRRAAELVADEIVRGSRLSREDAKAVDELLAQRTANEQVLVEKGLTLKARQRLRFTPAAVRSLHRYDSDFVIAQLLRGDEALADYEDAVASAVDLLAADEEAEFMPRVALDDPSGDRTLPVLGAPLLAIAQSTKTPRLSLWRVAQQAARGAYGRRTGLTLFTSLFHELALPEDLDGFGAPFATALLQALEREPADVRAAAKRAYARLLGKEAPAVVRTALR